MGMFAPAKINLMLHVLGRREDGYHLLQSLVMFADIGDRLTLEEAEAEFSLELRGPFAPLLEGDREANLVLRAGHALARSMGITPHGRMRLDKQLPLGAGLGGGSADAAAALRLLADAWGYRGALAPIAAELGSDVPACVHGAPLWMEDRGTELTPLVVPFEMPLLLVHAGIHVATAEVYQALRAPYAERMLLPPSFSSPASLLAFLKATANMLAPPAFAIAPVIGDLISEIQGQPGCAFARMSGSGSACFGLFETRGACDAAAARLSARHPKWWVKTGWLKGTEYGKA